MHHTNGWMTLYGSEASNGRTACRSNKGCARKRSGAPAATRPPWRVRPSAVHPLSLSPSDGPPLTPPTQLYFEGRVRKVAISTSTLWCVPNRVGF